MSRVSILLFVAISAVLSVSYAEENTTTSVEEFVLTLDHSNFDETISQHDFIVVEFYAPWCGHCKKLAPEYEKAASILKNNDPPITLAKIDANQESNREISSKYDIKGFPTLKIFRNGGKSIQEYKGPRESDGIVEYLKTQTGPASTEIKSSDDGTDLISDKKIAIVGVFSEYSGKEYENFMAVADKMRSDYMFHHTLNAKHLPRGEVSPAVPVVRLFKPFDELSVDFNDFDVAALEKFIEEASMPVVTVFNNDAFNHPYVIKFFNSPAAKAMLFLNFSSDSTDAFKSIYQEVATQYKGQDMVFLFGDLQAGKGAFQYFGLKEEQAPLIIVQANDTQKYLKPNVEPNEVAKWVKDYKEGKVSPFRKSEPIPEVNNEPVKIVVGDSLDDIFFQSGKNVLLEFYAPWCGHCKKLAPILEEVAISYQNEPEIVIAKMDATANDYPSSTFEVQGYPTLFFRSASGKVSQYEGNRSKEDIVSYIEKNRDTAAQEVTPPSEEAAASSASVAKDEL